MKRACLAGVLAVCLLQPVLGADKPWSAVTTGHFTVLSDANVSTGRDIASQVEQVRAAMQAFGPWTHADLDKPVLVLTVGSEDRMKALVPQYWEQKGGLHPGSVSANGADRYYIALRSDVKSDDRQ